MRMYLCSRHFEQIEKSNFVKTLTVSRYYFEEKNNLKTILLLSSSKTIVLRCSDSNFRNTGNTSVML